jgi:hypothetical protein
MDATAGAKPRLGHLRSKKFKWCRSKVDLTTARIP